MLEEAASIPAMQNVHLPEDDIAVIAGIVRILAGATLLTYVAMSYMLPLMDFLLQFSLPSTLNPDIIIPAVISVVLKLAGAVVLAWPGMYLLRK